MKKRRLRAGALTHRDLNDVQMRRVMMKSQGSL